MQLFYQPDIVKGALYLDEDESRHCIKVLRKKEGDILEIVDGFGGFYRGNIVKANPKKCEFQIHYSEKEEKKHYSIHIAIAPTKNIDRLEWFVEKAVELGVDQLTFIQCEHSERSRLNMERLMKKAISAMKQSLKFSLPIMAPLVDFTRFVSQNLLANKFIAYVDENIPGHLKEMAPVNEKNLVLIGPEGDFSANEISFALENGYKPVSLGKSRLRTETAGLAACHILNLISQ